MMSPTKLSLPCITVDRDKLEVNDNATFEVSGLGLEIYVRDKGLRLQFPVIDALNVVEVLKILLDSIYEQEYEYEEEMQDESEDEEFFSRGPADKTKLS